MMMQTLEGGDRPCLPHGLSVMNTFTEMTTGSKSVPVMVKSLTAALITSAKGVKVTQVVATNAVPQVEVALGTLEKLEEIHGIQQIKMSVEQRKEMLFQQLELSDLEGWSDKNHAAARALPAEYHDNFSLELESWGVLTWQIIRSESLMTSLSRRGSREFLHLWWMGSMHM